MDRSLVQAKQSRSDGAHTLYRDLSRAAHGCMRPWREGRTMPHAGYVGRSAGFKGNRLEKLHVTVDPVAGPIELADPRGDAARMGTLRSRPMGRAIAPRPFDAPRDQLPNIRRSSLR